MYLNKLLIKDFGKFNNKEISLKPGINVIQGAKSSGKTTIKEFITAMLYGFSSCSFNEKDNEKYEIYRPSDRGYSGKAYIKNGDNTYFVERSFTKKNSRTSVLDIGSGREIKVNNGSLNGKLFDLSRDDFVNGLCIDDNNGNYTEYVKKDFKNIISSGAVSIDMEKSIGILKEKRDSFDISKIDKNIEVIEKELKDFDEVDIELKEIRKRIKETEEELAIETARRKRAARRLIQTKTSDEDEDSEEESAVSGGEDKKSGSNEEKNDKKDTGALEVSQDKKTDDESTVGKSIFLDADLLKDYKPKKKLTDQVWFIILTGLFVIGVITAFVYILPFENAVRQIFVICTILFVIVTIVEGLFAKGIFDEDINTPSDEDFKRIIYELERKTESYEEVEIDMSFAQEYIKRREKYSDEERKILKRMARRDELREERQAQLDKKKKSERELHAINLAINTINDLSKDMFKSYGDMINENASDIIAKLSDNKYKDLYINDKRQIMVKDSSGYINLDKLDNEAFRIIYISIRLAMTRSLCKDKMPVVIDDILDGADSNLLAGFIEAVGRIKTDQLLILSSDKALVNMLDEGAYEYNLVKL
ncbi:MAG: AAA family ATPase [Lachnospiraceae bacterium]|nr:AAA family ATPase [Lachnospiraceae bacterium]